MNAACRFYEVLEPFVGRFQTLDLKLCNEP